ncbi:hypothetical protein [Paenibacillus planticolens]|uniref:hypothetical protein n=1 Tax=Paenibacillus planticolens TaxID=2654976 RepID=UPI00149224A7|nr:hypothetical protein [Paenibacillus planticolens]
MSDILLTDLGSVNGDLAANLQGDLNTVSGIENLTTALQRRFGTPLGALFYDTTYGNPVFQRLSSPMGKSFEQDVISDVSSCLLADSRVQSVQVRVLLNREEKTATFYVSFIAKDGSSGSFEQAVSIRV